MTVPFRLSKRPISESTSPPIARKSRRLEQDYDAGLSNTASPSEYKPPIPSLLSATMIRVCSVCRKPSTISQPLEQCSQCKRRSHPDCQGAQTNLDSPDWRCARCLRQYKTQLLKDPSHKLNGTRNAVDKMPLPKPSRGRPSLKVHTSPSYNGSKQDIFGSSQNATLNSQDLLDLLVSKAAVDADLRSLLKAIASNQASEEQKAQFETLTGISAKSSKPRDSTTAELPRNDSKRQATNFSVSSIHSSQGHGSQGSSHQSHVISPSLMDARDKELSPPLSVSSDIPEDVPTLSDAAVQAEIEQERDSVMVKRPSAHRSPNLHQVNAVIDSPQVITRCIQCGRNVLRSKATTVQDVACSSCKGAKDTILGLSATVTKTPEVIIIPESPVDPTDMIMESIEGNADNEPQTIADLSAATGPDSDPFFSRRSIISRRQNSQDFRSRTSLSSRRASINTSKPQSDTAHVAAEAIKVMRSSLASQPAREATAILTSEDEQTSKTKEFSSTREGLALDKLRCYNKELRRVVNQLQASISTLEGNKRSLNTQLDRVEAEVKAMKLKMESDATLHEAALVGTNSKLSNARQTHIEALRSKNEEIRKLKAELNALRKDHSVQDRSDQEIELNNLRNELAAFKKAKEAARIPVSRFMHLNLYNAAPELHPRKRLFDREARKFEIAGRPSKKDTLGKLLSSKSRRERGLYPHREVERLPGGMDVAVVIEASSESRGSRYTESSKSDNHNDVSDSTSSPGAFERGQDKSRRQGNNFDAIMGVPKNVVSCLVDNQLAYRDGTRDAKGRLPRAKASYKVGRNVAGQLR